MVMNLQLRTDGVGHRRRDPEVGFLGQLEDSLFKIEQLLSGGICNDGKNTRNAKPKALGDLTAFTFIHKQQISDLLMG